MCTPPDPCQTTVALRDDFNRPDSDIVGAPCTGCTPWREVQIDWIPWDNHEYDAVIDNGRLSFPTPDAAVVYRPHEGGAGGNDITVTWRYNSSPPGGRPGSSDGVGVRYDESYNLGRSVHQGLNLVIHPESDTITLRDEGTVLGVAPVVIDTGTDYLFRWDVYQDYSMNVWVWRASENEVAHTDAVHGGNLVCVFRQLLGDREQGRQSVR